MSNILEISNSIILNFNIHIFFFIKKSDYILLLIIFNYNLLLKKKKDSLNVKH